MQHPGPPPSPIVHRPRSTPRPGVLVVEYAIIEARQTQRPSTLHDSLFARCLIYMRPRSVGESNGHELKFDHKPALMRA